jgi:NAD-dependent deacetylase
VAAALAEAPPGSVVVLSGAGLSAESGIPTFRDPRDGLWSRYDPATYATIFGFDRSPHLIWELLRDFLKESDPKPNAGHLAVAELERLGLRSAVITQNVDNLHQDAGSTRVLEYHGSLMTAVCRRCKAPAGAAAPLLMGPLPPRCACGGPLKPSAVLFGEAIPPAAAREAAAAVPRCKILLVVGTSATVRPAADLPRIARDAGARVIEVNLTPTPLTDRISDEILLGKAGVVLPMVLSELRRLRALRGASGGDGAQGDARAALCASVRRRGRRVVPSQQRRRVAASPHSHVEILTL